MFVVSQWKRVVTATSDSSTTVVGSPSPTSPFGRMSFRCTPPSSSGSAAPKNELGSKILASTCSRVPPCGPNERDRACTLISGATSPPEPCLAKLAVSGAGAPASFNSSANTSGAAVLPGFANASVYRKFTGSVWPARAMSAGTRARAWRRTGRKGATGVPPSRRTAEMSSASVSNTGSDCPFPSAAGVRGANASRAPPMACRRRSSRVASSNFCSKIHVRICCATSSSGFLDTLRSTNATALENSVVRWRWSVPIKRNGNGCGPVWLPTMTQNALSPALGTNSCSSGGRRSGVASVATSTRLNGRSRWSYSIRGFRTSTNFRVRRYAPSTPSGPGCSLRWVRET